MLIEIKVPTLSQDCGEPVLRECPWYSKVSSRITDSALQGYPQEWIPSVSATIGDRYPERSVFQVFIAITSGTGSVP